MKIEFKYEIITNNKRGAIVIDCPKGKDHLTLAFNKIADVENCRDLHIEITEINYK